MAGTRGWRGRDEVGAGSHWLARRLGREVVRGSRLGKVFRSEGPCHTLVQRTAGQYVWEYYFGGPY